MYWRLNLCSVWDTQLWTQVVTSCVCHRFWPRCLCSFAYWLWEEPVLCIKAPPTHVPYSCCVTVNVEESVQIDVVVPFLQLLCCNLLPHRRHASVCCCLDAPVLCPCHFTRSEACRCRTVLCRHSLSWMELCSAAYNHLLTRGYCTQHAHRSTKDDMKCIPAAIIANVRNSTWPIPLVGRGHAMPDYVGICTHCSVYH